MTEMKAIHIIAGSLALFAGAIALYSRKGETVHRKFGMIFVYAILVMAALGSVMAALKPDRLSSLGGLITIYFVATSLLTVRRPVEQFRWMHTGAMLLGLSIGIAAFDFGLLASRNPRGVLDGFPAAGYYFFGGIALLAACLDIRVLIAGSIRGAHRLARHLWRMGFAMFMATGSFFLGQAKLFPAPVRKVSLLAIPVLLVVVTVIYWLVRVLLQGRARSRQVRAQDFQRRQPALFGEPS